MDDQAYLDPDFDPNSLTVPKLRSILVAHSIAYPSSAKKSQLVDIFNQSVRPQASSLRDASIRVKRSSRGIVDAGSEADKDEVEDDSVEDARRRTGRRTTRASTAEVQETKTPRGKRHSTAPPVESATGKRSSSKHARGSVAIQEEPEEPVEPEAKRPASRKSRASLAAVTPGVAQRGQAAENDSPFSTDNVFQSAGSRSPPAPADRRRTTLGPARDADARRQEVRRRTEGFSRPAPAARRPQTDGVVVPSRKSFDMRAGAEEVEEEGDADSVEPSEEFVPEEQQELVQAQRSGELVSTRRPKRREPAAKFAPLAVTIAMLGGLAALWRQEKVQVGYCGVGQPSHEVAGVHIPDWAEVLRPECEPCPPHAYCYEELRTVCEPDFVLTPHPLSLGGVVPLAPSCEPDSMKARKVQSVKERAVEELRQHTARYECGETSTPSVKESTLKQTIGSKRSKKMSDDEWEDLWSSAFGDIQAADEVVSGVDDRSKQFTLRSTSLARVPLSCAVRRSLSATFRQYLRSLVTVLSLLASAFYARHHWRRSRELEAKAKLLASEVFEQLRLQAAAYADGEVSEDRHVGVAFLRDDVLRDEFSAKRRADLWKRVQGKVEGNANVRSAVRESRTGDVGRVWEWVGAVPRGIEQSPYEGGNKSRSRISLGGGHKQLEGGEAATPSSGGKVSKWETGGTRAYY
ncbi:hypothetical protein MBLNU230_g8427t2 [Neophaeotheca triangularis]